MRHKILTVLSTLFLFAAIPVGTHGFLSGHGVSIVAALALLMVSSICEYGARTSKNEEE